MDVLKENYRQGIQDGFRRELSDLGPAYTRVAAERAAWGSVLHLFAATKDAVIFDFYVDLDYTREIEYARNLVNNLKETNNAC
jgi:hypothetical protein